MKTIIDFIWDTQCPNAKAARTNLMKAFSRVGLPPSWNEWRIGDEDNPERTLGFGSPTILINGKDLLGTSGAKGNSCRLYQNSGGKLSGVPDVETIATALTKANTEVD